jgi:hypothetical protein
MPADPEGDFALESGSFIKLAKRPVPKELKGKIRSKDLLNAIRRAVSSECKQEPTGDAQ